MKRVYKTKLRLNRIGLDARLFDLGVRRDLRDRRFKNKYLVQETNSIVRISKARAKSSVWELTCSGDLARTVINSAINTGLI